MNKCGDDIINYMYEFLEPIYVCILKPDTVNSGAAALACVSKYYYSQRKELHIICDNSCKIVKKVNNEICQAHCKAYPIYKIISNIYGDGMRNSLSHIHFPSKYIANFAPQLLPVLLEQTTCCGGKGIAMPRKRHCYSELYTASALYYGFKEDEY